jgi:NADPH2:quinone reductase
MQAVVVAQPGGPEVLMPTTLPLPEPGPAEVLVHNRFVGVNFVDTQHRAGLYYPVVYPLIPGIEAAGVVAAVGATVTDFAVGDRVAYAGYMGGDYAEYTLVPPARLVAVPAAVPLEQAAAGLLQGITALVLARQVYTVQPGDHVLIHAAAGGVGNLLVQIAKQAGAVVIGTTSTAEKAGGVRQAGADHVIVTTPTDFASAIQDLAPQGVHVVYDGVGGPLFEQNLNVLRARGTLVMFGLAGGHPPPLDISRLSGLTGAPNRGSLFLTWAAASDYIATTAELRSAAAAVFDALVDGRLRLRIAGTYPLAQAAMAHHRLESRTVEGKLLLEVT